MSTVTSIATKRSAATAAASEHDRNQRTRIFMLSVVGVLLVIGLGTSRSRWDYLPNAHTDFIFSIIGEELGFAGATFVVVLFAVLTILGIAVAMRAPDRFGAMLAAGITTWLGFQAFVNIGGVTGMIPITGMTLPFISFGGSSLIMALGAVGVLLNIASKGVSGRER